MNKDAWMSITLDDIKTLAAAGGYDLTVVPSDDGAALSPEEKPLGDQAASHDLLKDLAECAFTGAPDEFVALVDANMERLLRMSFINNNVGSVVVEGLKLGVSQKCGASASCLGALYYMGDFVEQDYAKAAELYELGMDWGNPQSMINLGYIYEYGRLGSPDYTKAYVCYSTAAALFNASEALYKMGDMLEHGKGFERNHKAAVELWKKSHVSASDAAEAAQPSIRLAPLYLTGDPNSDISQDVLFALKLYQDAEVGLRKDIAKGMTYYEKRLEEAVEGQLKARSELDLWMLREE